MALSAEQFNKLATKGDLRNFVTKEEFIDGKNEILNAVDEIKQKFDDHKTEHSANQAAHDRFEGRITTVEKKVGIADKVNTRI